MMGRGLGASQRDALVALAHLDSIHDSGDGVQMMHRVCSVAKLAENEAAVRVWEAEMELLPHGMSSRRPGGTIRHYRSHAAVASYAAEIGLDRALKTLEERGLVVRDGNRGRALVGITEAGRCKLSEMGFG